MVKSQAKATKPARRILTVLSNGQMYQRQQGRLLCDGRWRRYLDVAPNDHEWPGTEGSTIVYESPSDPASLPRLSPEEKADRLELIIVTARAMHRRRVEMRMTRMEIAGR